MPRPARRESEVCYERAAIEDEPRLAALLDLQLDGLYDANGCISGGYAGWLAGGGCLHDPDGAVLRDGECCYELTDGPPACGRPLVVAGAARVAPPVPDIHARLGADVADENSSDPEPVRSLPDVAEVIGREWLRDALLEHASVAAFSVFTLSLMAVGAPASLVAESQRAGLDEAEHARLCFAMAHRYLGERQQAGRLDLSGLRIATELDEIAVRTFLDGCVEETIAALTARAQLEVATDAEGRAALERIAEDETRHAELAWKLVAWAVASGGPRIAHAIEAVARKLGAPRAPIEEEQSPSMRACLHRAGRLTPAECARVRAGAIAFAIRPALAALVGPSRLADAPPSHASRQAATPA